MGQLTEEQLRHLSPDEREFYAQIAEEDDSVDETEEVDHDESHYDAPEADDTGDDPDADDGAADADDADAGDAEGDGEGDGDPEDDPEGDGDGQQGDDGDDAPAEGDDPGEEQPQPEVVARLRDDWQADMDEVANKLTALEEQYDDGELDKAEYTAERDKLRQQEKALDREYTVVEAKAQWQRDQQRQEWASEVSAFLRDNPQYQSTDPQNPENNENPLYDALDAQVKRIAKANPNLPGREVLRRAHERFAKATGRQDDAANKPPAKKQRRQVPPTLKDVPASQATPTDDGGKFAQLDKLDGLALEKALAGMSEKELADYMSR